MPDREVPSRFTFDSWFSPKDVGEAPYAERLRAVVSRREGNWDQSARDEMIEK